MAGVGTVTITITDWRCVNCEALTVDRDWARVSHWGSGTDSGVPAQLTRAGVRFSGGGYTTGRLCVECAKEKAGRFVCALCKQERTSDLAHDQWGSHPTEFVCVPCYETTPAKQWDAFVDGMEQEHRWDHE